MWPPVNREYALAQGPRAGQAVTAMNRAGPTMQRRDLTLEDLNFSPPQFAHQQLAQLAEQAFGLSGRLQALPGERDQNVRLTDASGRHWVVKVSSAAERPAVVDFQVRALQHLQHTAPDLPVPRILPDSDGRPVHHWQVDGCTHAVRVLSWLPGIPYQDGPEPSAAGLLAVGRFLARLDAAFLGFEHPASGHFMPWDVGNGLLFNPSLQALLPAALATQLEPALQRLETVVYPRLQQLPRQVIHQDGHGGNLLRASADDEQVSGLIDFGDLVEGCRITDLAVCASHFLENGEQPAAIAAAMVTGFNQLLPLSGEETDLLLDLVMARQIQTLMLFEFRRINMQHPPDFVTADQPGIIASLRRLLALDRPSFNQHLRECL